MSAARATPVCCKLVVVATSAITDIWLGDDAGHRSARCPGRAEPAREFFHGALRLSQGETRWESTDAREILRPRPIRQLRSDQSVTGWKGINMRRMVGCSIYREVPEEECIWSVVLSAMEMPSRCGSKGRPRKSLEAS
jgi:hypothetical protein